LYGLTSQMRRAAVSIPSNLAEGSGKNTDADVARFARISLGSAKELEYQLLLARDLGYVTDPAYQSLDIPPINRSMLKSNKCCGCSPALSKS